MGGVGGHQAAAQARSLLRFARMESKPAASSNHPRIGEILIEAHTIDESSLAQALRAQQQTGGVIGEHLVRLGALDDDTLLKALSQQTRLQHANLAKVEIGVELQRLVRFETVRDRRVMPLALEGRTLVLGMVKPDDLAALAHLQFETGHTLRPVLLSAGQHARAVALLETWGWGRRPFKLPALPESDAAARAHPPTDLQDLLGVLVARRGQDLCLSTGAIPAIKVDGELERVGHEPLVAGGVERLVVPFLSAAQYERFQQELELDFALVVPSVGRFRCNLYRQRCDCWFAARHVLERIPSFEQLGVPAFMHEFALARQGLVVIVGPTGHGKTTTLAAMLDVVNRERRANVVTIEDPIEYVHHHGLSNVNQREVGQDVRSFAEGLRHVFRQSPDVIVIGELRDLESTQIALQAAETGHLVLATMHSLDSTSTVDRIIDLFPPNQHTQVRAQLADALECVFSQRLVKKAKGPGRVLAWERMSKSLRVRNAIRDGKAHTLRTFMQSNHEELQSIDQSLARLVASGQITRDEAAKFEESSGYVDDLIGHGAPPAKGSSLPPSRQSSLPPR
jgi:twitching motility protein PilT